MTEQAHRHVRNAPDYGLALDLTNDAVTLYVRRDSDTWTPAGKATLDAPNFDEQIDMLRVEALVRARDDEFVLLWLPPEQLISREMTLAPGSADAARTEALARISEETDFDPSELTVAMAESTDPNKTLVMAALLQTISEAQTYSETWGFPRTIVSTRNFDPLFGTNGPVFSSPPTIARQAGQALRRLAVAATVMIAVVGGVYGGYRAIAPLLEEPADIRSSGPAISSFAVVVDPVYSSVNPLRSVTVGTANSLALQRLFIPDDDRINSFGVGAYAGDLRPLTPPTLRTPSAGARLLVGSAPVLPRRDRPGRLETASDVQKEPDLDQARVAIDRIRQDADQTGSSALGASSSAASPPREALAALDAPNSGSSSFPPDAAQDATDPALRDGKETKKQQVEPSIEPIERDTEQPKSETADEADAPTDRAPLEMAGLPLPRPIIAGSEDPSENAQETATPSQAETKLAASAEPETQDVKQTARQQDDQEDERVAETSERLAAEAKDFSSASVLEPAKVLKVFERQPVQPGIENFSMAAVAIPNTVRSTAREVGLELDRTSLISVIDGGSIRQALVRMPSGAYRTVSRGDVLGGWRVSSIGRDAMRLTKRGQNRTLLRVAR